MRLFTRLFDQLDSTTRTSEKVRALEAYFTAAAPRDAAWALYFLIGRKVKRAVNTRLLREWLAAETGIPLWLIEESYDAVGDLSETLALLLRDNGGDTDMPLHRVVEERILPLPGLSAEQQQALVVQTWRELDARQRLVWHKLIMGEFRIGVARTLVARAVAHVAGVDSAIMAHRLMGNWQPDEDDYRRLIHGSDGHGDVGKPYPFFLAHPLEGPPSQLGDPADWQAEWKWDGIRAQLIRREGEVMIWSRGEELITDRFPEAFEVGRLLPDGTVLDGEILAWRGDGPLPFAVLQRRIGRKTVSQKLRSDAPAAFMVYDILEHEGRDIRSLPLVERRKILESMAERVHRDFPLRVSPIVQANTWEQIEELQATARERGVEGLMVKRLSAPYGVGRPRGDWWKWKVSPHSIDAVLIYAQRGHGRRASLYTDYTFGVWDDGQLVPIAKAYSGLTDEEIHEVDRFVRRHTRERFGTVRVVEPQLVFELHFEGIQISKRHKAGLAVRFPRMARWRHEKKPADADTLDTLRTMAQTVEAQQHS
jgi:DNA ligase 1